MELDELKKSWKTLDNRLDQQPPVSDKDLQRLLVAGKASAHRGLKRLNLLQSISLVIGVTMLAILVLTWLLMPDFMLPTRRIIILLAFLAVSLVAGLIWDWHTYKWVKSIRVDQMSVAEVSRRMTIFRQNVHKELVAVCVWVVIFNALNFWVMGYHLAPLPTQLLVIALLAATDVIIIYLLYKKVMYRNINHIRKNIEELKDICTE